MTTSPPPDDMSMTVAEVSTLPHALTSLVGREQEIAAVLLLLEHEDVRLVTLTGPGGVGKTRLALKVGERAAGEVWFVALASIQGSSLVMPATANALGTKEVAAGTSTNVVVKYLQERRAFLILDTFEQVLDAGTGIIGILSAYPHLAVVITSRSRLRVPDEYVFRVSPFSHPSPKKPVKADSLLDIDAVRLFIDQASAATSAFLLSSANAQVKDHGRLSISTHLHGGEVPDHHGTTFATLPASRGRRDHARTVPMAVHVSV